MINDGKTISNLYTKCRIDIIKMDKDSGELLENTGFSLCNDKGKEISRGYTDSEGKLSFENLPEGTYYIREFKACEGYRKDESVHQVILSKENREKKMNKLLFKYKRGYSLKMHSGFKRQKDIQ